MIKIFNTKFSLIALILVLVLSTQTLKPQEWGIKFSGFVKTDVMFDTRQTENLREGHFLLIPLPQNLNSEGKDLNAKSSLNILSIQTRIVGNITAPDVLGAKATGYIEAEFFGASESDGNGFRLRHAFTKLDWDYTTLLVGQTWHPMFVAECFPGTVSFNTGVPFQPFSRNPQIRLTQKFGEFSISAAAIAQRDFTNSGPDASGANSYSSSFLRNSVVPDLFFGLNFNTTNFMIGAGGEYKMITPRTVTTKKLQTDKTVNSFAGFGYIKTILDPVTIKLQGTYGQNLSNMMMHGGYAIKSIDTLTGQEDYTNMNVMTLWTDISAGNEVEFGVFAGFSKNMGFDDNILDGTKYYARYFYNINNENITLDYLYRISPRIQWNIGKVRLASEFEWTSAKFGTIDNNNKGKVKDGGKEANNLRVLLACYIFF
ncbi:MAG TPA: hypothetical protein PKY56_03915 [Candidatus Kapabacteria bacterium]|nr:hypothetical protein [Candidatus Kapabacteria bacterium]HPO62646.1 hypothetical protein [Candidatus Kapabacteria bacterium]